MASGYAPWYMRYILFKIPGLYKKQACGNYHPFWDRFCYCDCDFLGDGTIRNVIDLKTGHNHTITKKKPE